MKPIKIIQSSSPRTGSTLLINLIHGFLRPKEEIHWHTETKIHEFLITKTHNTNIDWLISTYKEYELYFIMCERNDVKIKQLINDKYRNYKNILIIDYNNINVTDKLSLEEVIEYIFNQFFNFLPQEIIPNKNNVDIKNDMLYRINAMNRIVEQLKNRSFDYWEPFYGIHGSHRHRN